MALFNNRYAMLITGLLAGFALLGVLVGVNRMVQSSATENKKQLYTDIETLPTAAFSDVTLISGLKYSHRQHTGEVRDVIDSTGGGACVADFNNDGWMDVVFASGGGQTRYYGRKSWWQDHKPVALFRNNEGQFSTVENTALHIPQSSTACATADFNGDGLVDIMIATTTTDYLFANQGDWQFVPIPLFSKLANPVWTTHISVADINGDGLPDVHLAHFLKYRQNLKNLELSSGFTEQHHHQMDPGKFDGLTNQVLINTGNFTFADRTIRLGLSDHPERTISSSWQDINRDGRIDLIEYNVADNPLRTYLQTEDSQFAEVLQQHWGMLVNDVHFSAFGQQMMDPEPLWLLTRGAGLSNIARYGPTFDSDVSWDLGLTSHKYIFQEQWGSVFSDFNNDGYVDVAIASGSHDSDPFSPQMTIPMMDLCATRQTIRRTARYTAFDVLPCSVEGQTSSRSVVKLDYNNDGKQDLLFVANNDALRLLKNTSEVSGNWITLTRPADAEVQYLHSSGRWLALSGQQAMFGSHEPRVHLGLGNQPDIQVRVVKQGRELSEGVLTANAFYLFDGQQWQAQHYTAASAIPTGEDIATFVRASIGIDSNETWLAQANQLLAQASDTQLAELADIISRYPQPSQLAFYLQLIKHANATLADTAARAVDALEDESSALYLLSYLEHPDSPAYCRTTAIFNHWFDEEEAVTRGKYRAVPYLIRGLGAAGDTAVNCSATALGGAEQINGALAIIDAMDSASPGTYPALVNALGKIRQREAIPTLLQLLANTRDVSVIQQILIALTRLDYTPTDQQMRQLSQHHPVQVWLAVALLDKALDGIVISASQRARWMSVVQEPKWQDLHPGEEQSLYIQAALLGRARMADDVLLSIQPHPEDAAQLASLWIKQGAVDAQVVMRVLDASLTARQLDVLAHRWPVNASLSSIATQHSLNNALSLWGVLQPQQQQQLLTQLKKADTFAIDYPAAERLMQQCRSGNIRIPVQGENWPMSLRALSGACALLSQRVKDTPELPADIQGDLALLGQILYWAGRIMPSLPAQEKNRLSSWLLYRSQLAKDARSQWALTHFHHDSLSEAWLCAQVSNGDVALLELLLDRRGYDMLAGNLNIDELLANTALPQQTRYRLQSYRHLPDSASQGGGNE